MKPNIEHAIGLLRRGLEVANRDHRRELDGTAVWHDLGALEMTVKLALDELEPGVDHTLARVGGHAVMEVAS